MIRHRIRQFREAALAPSPDDLALAGAHLDGELLRLFQTQHPRDIRHSARTARWLLERGHSGRDIILAALLHDVGKGAQRRRDRVAHVLGGVTGIGNRLADPRSRFEVRRAVYRSLQHSEAGSRLVAEAGAPARVTALTRLHHAPAAGDPVLALLQQADAAN